MGIRAWSDGGGALLTGVMGGGAFFLKMMNADEGTMICKMAVRVEGRESACVSG